MIPPATSARTTGPTEREDDVAEPARRGPRRTGAGGAGGGASTVFGRRRRSAATTRPTPPTISSPIRCSAPGSFSTMPVTRPRKRTAIRSQRSTSSSRSVETTSEVTPSLGLLADARAHRLRRLDVEAVRRLVDRRRPSGRTRARGPARPSGCCRPRACPTRVVGPGRADVVAGDQSRARLRRSRAGRMRPRAPERRLADPLEDEVEADAEARRPCPRRAGRR